MKQKPKSLLQKFELHHPVCTSLLIATAVISFWRGLWGMMDTYLFPEQEFLSYAVSILIGIVLLLLHHGFTRLQELE